MKIILSIVTVTYNSENYIKQLLDSVIKSKIENSEIIVFDNDSTDKTIDIIEDVSETIGSTIRLIRSNQNLGFSKGNNKAVKEASGEYLLFLNPDIQVKNESIKKLLDYIQINDDIGILAPKLIKGDIVQKSVRKSPSLLGVIKEYLLGMKHQYSEYVPSAKEAAVVDVVYGAAIMMRKKVFEEVGGFTEKYFLYYEDTDICRKVKELGKKVVYYPEAVMSHSLGYSKVETENLPFGLRTISLFFPIKKSGKQYFQVQGRNIYHGLFISFLITLIIYISQKLRLSK